MQHNPRIISIFQKTRILTNRTACKLKILLDWLIYTAKNTRKNLILKFNPVIAVI